MPDGSGIAGSCARSLAVVVTLLTMHRAGLYRARVCALRSTEVARTIAASVLGAGVFVAWRMAGRFACQLWPAIEGAGAAVGGGARRPVALRSVVEGETG